MSQIISRIGCDLRTGTAKTDRKMQLNAFSNWWICEGWSEIRFEWRLNEATQSNQSRNRVKLHLSWDNFTPDKMRRDKYDKTLFSVTRMVPPGDLKFYFSINDVKMVSSSVKVIESDEIVETICVPKTNIIENIIQKDQLITKTYLTDLKAIPRPARRKQRPRPKSPWDVSKSVFKTYQDDTDALLTRCFEFDWNCSKIPKMISNYHEYEKIKKFLKTNYRAM